MIMNISLQVTEMLATYFSLLTLRMHMGTRVHDAVKRGVVM